MNHTPPLTCADRRGRYRVERLIGRGGMGAVYEVEHEGLGRRFAMKVLLSPGPKATSRLEREGRALAVLDHPHVVAPVDFGMDGDEPYLVMELLSGETLGARIERAGRLSVEEIAAVFLPICSALGAAHALGLVHRDLKPSNVVLATGPGGRVIPKVLDFGIARWMYAPSSTLTGADVVGTVGYLAPEVARGEGVTDGQTDLYSLGVMIFECATGRLPFVGETSYQVMHAIVTARCPAPSSLVEGLPHELDALVASAMARERDARISTARAFGQALLAFADGPTHALWEPEFGGDARAVGGRESAPRISDATLTEDQLAAVGKPRSSRMVRLWDRRAAVAFFGATALTLFVLGSLRLGATSVRMREPPRAEALTALSSLDSEIAAAPKASPPAADAVVRTTFSSGTASASPNVSTRPTEADAAAMKHAGARPLPKRSVSPTPPAATVSATPEALSATPPTSGPAGSIQDDKCNPPFTLDAQGRKHFRTECFLSK